MLLQDLLYLPPESRLVRRLLLLGLFVLALSRRRVLRALRAHHPLRRQLPARDPAFRCVPQLPLQLRVAFLTALQPPSVL